MRRSPVNRGYLSGTKDCAAALEVISAMDDSCVVIQRRTTDEYSGKYPSADMLLHTGLTNDAHNLESAIFVDSCFMVNDLFDPAGINGGARACC